MIESREDIILENIDCSLEENKQNWECLDALDGDVKKVSFLETTTFILLCSVILLIILIGIGIKFKKWYF